LSNVRLVARSYQKMGGTASQTVTRQVTIEDTMFSPCLLEMRLESVKSEIVFVAVLILLLSLSTICIEHPSQIYELKTA
jgi:hypothetical protein